MTRRITLRGAGRKEQEGEMDDGIDGGRQGRKEGQRFGRNPDVWMLRSGKGQKNERESGLGDQGERRKGGSCRRPNEGRVKKFQGEGDEGEPNGGRPRGRRAINVRMKVK